MCILTHTHASTHSHTDTHTHVHLSTHFNTCRLHTSMHVWDIHGDIQFTHICRHHCKHTTHTQYLLKCIQRHNTHKPFFLYILAYTQTYTHASMVLAGVWLSCQHQRLTEEEEVEEDKEEGARVMLSSDWALPCQQGRAELRDWWGRSSRLIIKPFWAAVFLLQCCLHCVSLCLYLVFASYPASEAAPGALSGGRQEGELSKRTCGQVGPISSAFFRAELPITVPELAASCGFISLWLTPGKVWEAWGPPHPPTHSPRVSLWMTSIPQ